MGSQPVHEHRAVHQRHQDAIEIAVVRFVHEAPRWGRSLSRQRPLALKCSGLPSFRYLQKKEERRGTHSILWSLGLLRLAYKSDMISPMSASPNLSSVLGMHDRSHDEGVLESVTRMPTSAYILLRVREGPQYLGRATTHQDEGASNKALCFW